METQIGTFGDGRVSYSQFEALEPAAGEISGHTICSLISPGTELALIHGDNSPHNNTLKALGYASVFQVEHIGAGVTNYSRGDIVLCEGPHASYQRISSARGVRVPTGLEARSALFARMMSVSASAMVTSRARPGHRVGIVGLGLVGQLAARVFVASGFEVLAAELDDNRRILAPSTVTVTSELPEESCDLVLDCSGREAGILAGARALRSGGELVLTGVPWTRTSDLPLFELATLLFHHYLTVRSGWEWQLPYANTPPLLAEPTMHRNITNALRWLHDGSVTVAGLFEEIYVSTASDAYALLQRRESPAPTYVLRWS